MRCAILCLAMLPAAAAAVPCTVAKVECTEWVTVGGGPSRSLVYRSHPMTEKNEQITRALIVVHGTNRDADNYYRTAVASAFLAGALDDTVVIAPRIASNDGRGCKDALEENEVSYSCSGDSWRSGGTALSNPKLTSFHFMDDLLRQLARKQAFPNLKTIVVAGHSAGGQYVNRYEMANTVHETLGVPVSYVVSNPSSYAYLDSSRPTADGKETRTFSDARNCTTFDRWPYGFQARSGYAGGLPDAQLRKQLAARPVVYLLGELDILPLAGFDSSCPAMAQGPTRLARGQAFGKYVNSKFDAQHETKVVPLCGHNARCMFTADAALPVLFPKQ